MAKIRMAQYGTKHGHARGKMQAMLVNPDVEVAGVFEPDPQQREKLQNGGTFADVHWYANAEEMLSDDSIVAVASEGNNAESLDQTEQIVNAGKHVWYDKPAGENWEQWQRVINTAQEKIPTRTDGLHATVSFRLQASCRMGAHRLFRRCFLRSRPHVNQHLLRVPHPHQPTHRRYLLRLRRTRP